MPTKKKRKFGIVRHSGYCNGGNRQFYGGLEVVELSPKEEAKVERLGGVMFDRYLDAEEYTMRRMYPDGYLGLIPLADKSGRFSNHRIHNLNIYLPEDGE